MAEAVSAGAVLVEPGDGPALMLDLDGFEGPIDLLLVLAREQKVDLARLSISALADQYLAFVAAARRLRLELAADYLVMASWLAYLKSRLLLPEPDPDPDEPSGAELARDLAAQLQRLAAMQRGGHRLMALPRLGIDVLAPGAPEGVTVLTRPVYTLTLYDLMRAYGEARRRGAHAIWQVVPSDLSSIEEAIQRLAALLGTVSDWTPLARFVPRIPGSRLAGRSALAAHFVAGLELVRSGRAELRQEGPFRPLYLRPRAGDPAHV
jgi:segregation and condensation protein A